MTGLFTGIIGSLIGAGIQATFGGIPIREDASQALEVLRRGGLPVPPANWFSQNSSEQQKTEPDYDQFGQHIAGAIQALGPSCMKIASAALKGGSNIPESQPIAPAKAPSEAYYKSGEKTSNFCSCKKAASIKSVNNFNAENCKQRENFCPESNEQMGNRKTKKTEEKFSEGFYEERKMENVRRPTRSQILDEPWLIDKMLGKEICKKGKTDPRGRDMKSDFFMSSGRVSKDSKRSSSTVTKQSQKSGKPQSKIGKSFRNEKCQLCQAQIENIRKPPLMPNCGHIVCHGCVQISGKLFKCPKCGLKFN